MVIFIVDRTKPRSYMLRVRGACVLPPNRIAGFSNVKFKLALRDSKAFLVDHEDEVRENDERHPRFLGNERTPKTQRLSKNFL